MRQNRYILKEQLSPNVFLYYNSFSNQFLFLDQTKHDYMEKGNFEVLRKNDIGFYEILKDGLFLVEDDYDELKVIMNQIHVMQTDQSYYHVMVNTTLDCNLNCWYCYENKIAGSKLSSKAIQAIQRNIEWEYNSSKFELLKLSFFGGEPFMDFGSIKLLLNYAKRFCEENRIQLIADFTTNAVLITKQQIEYLKQFRCHFQITLDGDRCIHNKVKYDRKNPSIDTYQKVIDILTMIDQVIPYRMLAVRINFDNRTLGKIDQILSDIDFLDRHHCYIILKKVWQVDRQVVDKNLLQDAIQKAFDKHFLLDYYIMPKGSVCYACRQREVLFNYDGKVFKCSTISRFNDANSLGKLDFSTGKISWYEEKIHSWFEDLLPLDCKQCKWFPVCLGPCNKQLLSHKGEKLCTFDAMNMDNKEYMMYSFKYHLLKNELSNQL